MLGDRQRRWFLRSAALAAAAGLAGCTGGEESGGGTTTGASPTGGTDTASDTPTETSTAEPAETAAERTPYEDPKAAVDRWLSGVSNYDGSVVDGTEQSEGSQTVQVGVNRPSGDSFGYGPPALRVVEGTTVQWRWSGKGGEHSVTERTGAFDSGSPQSSSGVTFTHEFTEPGVYLYRCENHGGTLGMRGAVIVQEQQTLSGYPAVDDWLDDYEFDGQLADGRGQSSVEVTVGASGNEGNFAFDPNALYVERGTEIVFEWTGRGGAHDVTWEDAALGDSDSTSSAAKTYAVTIDEPGVYLYSCGSHAPTGGRGAIVVGD